MRLMGRPVITQHDNEQETTCRQRNLQKAIITQHDYEQETTCRQRNLQKAKYKLGHPTT